MRNEKMKAIKFYGHLTFKKLHDAYYRFFKKHGRSPKIIHMTENQFIQFKQIMGKPDIVFDAPILRINSGFGEVSYIIRTQLK